MAESFTLFKADLRQDMNSLIEHILGGRTLCYINPNENTEKK